MREAIKTDYQQLLINGIKANDSKVLKELYTTNYNKIEAFILSNSGTVDHAKDIYQEAFISVWKNVKMNKFEPQNESALQGYLYRIAKNKWMDVLRSKTFKKTNTLNDEKQLATHYKTEQSEIEEDVFEKNLNKIMDAFKVLGQPCKQLLTTFYFDKKSLRDIALKLDIEETTARNKKYRCMQKLRELVLASNK